LSDRRITDKDPISWSPAIKIELGFHRRLCFYF